MAFGEIKFNNTPSSLTTKETEKLIEKEKLEEEVREIEKNIYFKKKGTLKEDILLTSLGIDPDNENGPPLFGKVSGNIGRNFEAHGIAKSNQLQTLLNLLKSGINPNKPFSTAPFELRDEERAMGSVMGTAGGTAYKDGIAVITSGFREDIAETGIKHVFINDVYAELKSPLQKLFPNIQIHLLSEQKDILEKEADGKI